MEERNVVLGNLFQEVQGKLAYVLRQLADGSAIDHATFEAGFAEIREAMGRELPDNNIASVLTGDPGVVKMQVTAMKDVTDLLVELLTRPEEMLVAPEN